MPHPGLEPGGIWMRQKRLSTAQKQKRNLWVTLEENAAFNNSEIRFTRKKKFHRFIYNYSFVIARRIKG